MDFVFKDYNLKIASLLAAVIFLLNSAVYGIDLSNNKAYLRVPAGQKSTYDRMHEKINAEVPKGADFEEKLLERINQSLKDHEQDKAEEEKLYAAAANGGHYLSELFRVLHQEKIQKRLGFVERDLAKIEAFVRVGDLTEARRRAVGLRLLINPNNKAKFLEGDVVRFLHEEHHPVSVRRMREGDDERFIEDVYKRHKDEQERDAWKRSIGHKPEYTLVLENAGGRLIGYAETIVSRVEDRKVLGPAYYYLSDERFVWELLSHGHYRGRGYSRYLRYGLSQLGAELGTQTIHAVVPDAIKGELRTKKEVSISSFEEGSGFPALRALCREGDRITGISSIRRDGNRFSFDLILESLVNQEKITPRNPKEEIQQIVDPETFRREAAKAFLRMIVRRIMKDVVKQILPGDLEAMEGFYGDKLFGTPQEVQRDPRLIERRPYFPQGLLIHMVHRGYYRSMRLDSEDEFLSLLAEVNPEMSRYADAALGFHAAFRQAQAEHEWTQPFAEALRVKLPTEGRILTDFNLLCGAPKTEQDRQLSNFGGLYGLTQSEVNRLKTLLWPSPGPGAQAYYVEGGKSIDGRGSLLERRSIDGSL